jgi:hypothetical protein
VQEGEPALATFALEVNEWNGVSEPRLRLRHAAPDIASEPVEPVESVPAATLEQLVLI